MMTSIPVTAWQKCLWGLECAQNGHFPAGKLFSVHGSLWNWEMPSMRISLTGVCRIWMELKLRVRSAALVTIHRLLSWLLMIGQISKQKPKQQGWLLSVRNLCLCQISEKPWWLLSVRVRLGQKIQFFRKQVRISEADVYCLWKIMSWTAKLRWRSLMNMDSWLILPKMEQRQWRKLRIRLRVIMIWCWWMCRCR